MSSTRQRANPGGLGEAAVPLAILALVGVVVGGTWASMYLAARFAGEPAPPSNPFANFFSLVSGEASWSQAATIAAVAIGLVLVVLLVLAMVIKSKMTGSGGGSQRVDRAARHMGRGREVDELSQRSAGRSARRMGTDKNQLGIPLGRAVATGQPLWSNWENTLVDVWGPRTGKTTSMAIPSILAAPGACVATSNKRDLVDATRDPRAEQGRVWIFDPQSIVGEEPSWWWDPLSYVTDENRASELAGFFASASRADDTRSDPFWEESGEDLLAGLLLAAAVAGKPISTVADWLVTASEDLPARILEERYPRIAARLQAFVNQPVETRGGVYANAQAMARVLTNSEVLRWVEPPQPWEDREHFDPHAFVRSSQTLYSLSKEGRGTAGGVVTALTAAVLDAAETLASTQPGGRLTTPLVAVLDEAANVCRWRELPDLYSHYGSRGIVIRSIFQSPKQAVAAFGKTGWEKLWSAANVVTYGGGVKDREFLADLSELIGDYDRPSTSVSQSQGRRSVSRDLRSERILAVSDLGALPKGRAVVLASGAKPTLVRTVPWMDGPHAESIKASIRAHDPQAESTLAQAETEQQLVHDADAQRTSASSLQPPTSSGVQW